MSVILAYFINLDNCIIKSLICINNFTDKLKHVSRTNPAIIVYGLYLCFSSRNYRLASKSLESMVKRTHMYRFGNGYTEVLKIADRFKVNKHLVEEVFVDEIC